MNSIFIKFNGIFPNEYLSKIEIEFNNIKKAYLEDNINDVCLFAGHFCELISSLLCKLEMGINENINNISFNSNYTKLKRSSKTNAHEEVSRLIIPRVLRAIYTIRNKKKVGHFKDTVPSRIDMKFVDNSVKWIIVQLLILYVNYNDSEVVKFLESISLDDYKHVERFEDGTTIFYKNLTLDEHIIFHLYEHYNSGRIPKIDLIKKVNPKNKSYFNKRLIKLVGDLIIVINSNGVILTQKGIEKAISIRKKLKE